MGPETQASIFKRHNELRSGGSGSELEETSGNRDQLFQVKEESYKSFSPSRSRFHDDSYHSSKKYMNDHPGQIGPNTYPNQASGYNRRDSSLSIDRNDRKLL